MTETHILHIRWLSFYTRQQFLRELKVNLWAFIGIRIPKKVKGYLLYFQVFDPA